MTLYEKSLRTLELPAVLELLAGEAVSEAAKAAARELGVCDGPYTVAERLVETTAAARMISSKGNPPFAAVRDVRGSVRRADMGGSLNTTELLDIALLLRVCAASVSYSGGHDGAPDPVTELFAALRPHRALETKISVSITGPDEISDAASTHLADIRRRMRAAEDRIRAVLNKIITSSTYAPALQEALITSRNGRYVVPVKSERKSSVPGLVHDSSSTGATLFIEPAAAVAANNELHELAADERREIDRILAELSADCAACGEDIASAFDCITALDFIFAKAKLSHGMGASEPELSGRGEVRLIRARHPLLPRGAAVPIDFSLGADFDTVVITGPNTGGKTVALKTLGLLCAMALCGLHIPADSGSAVPAYRAILADIGDEQSIEQSLSTFSSHMTNIVKMLDAGGDGSLMLFDELGAGTDPSEGAALAVAIIERARSSGACVVATTHYPQLKTYALTKPGVINASCEFDIETLRPTYKLLIGVPGKSNAFAISRRLGLPEDVIEEAGRLIDGDSVSLEDVLGGLEAERKRTRDELEAANRMLESARADSERAAKYLEELRRDRDRARELARREAKASLDAARETASAVMSELADIRKRAAEDGDLLRLNEAKADIFRKLNAAAASLDTGTEDAGPEQLGADTIDDGAAAPGDTVMLRAYGTRAVVESIGPDGALSLVAGNIRLTARPDEVARVKGKAAGRRAAPQKTPDSAVSAARVGAELDIRGMASDEAIDLVERYISDALMSKLETVTVIHGKGTGILRRAVHETLRRSPSVKSFRLGRYGEGETGVTVVTMGDG